MIMLKGAIWKILAQLVEKFRPHEARIIFRKCREEKTMPPSTTWETLEGQEVRVTHTWTNSSRVKEIIDNELRKGKTVIQREGIRWARDREANTGCMNGEG